MNGLNHLLIATRARAGVETRAEMKTGPEEELRDGVGPGKGQALPKERFWQGE